MITLMAKMETDKTFRWTAEYRNRAQVKQNMSDGQDDGQRFRATIFVPVLPPAETDSILCMLKTSTVLEHQLGLDRQNDRKQSCVNMNTFFRDSGLDMSYSIIFHEPPKPT